MCRAGVTKTSSKADHKRLIKLVINKNRGSLYSYNMYTYITGVQAWTMHQVTRKYTMVLSKMLK